MSVKCCPVQQTWLHELEIISIGCLHLFVYFAISADVLKFEVGELTGHKESPYSQKAW